MTKALDCALRLLARREHGLYELKNKLKRKGFSPDEVEQAVAECQRMNVQSDQRFAEAVLRSKMRQGYGPSRIRLELESKKIDPEVIDEAFHSEDVDWHACALSVWEKKCSEAKPDFTTLLKTQRFLMYRGFSPDLIKEIARNFSKIE